MRYGIVVTSGDPRLAADLAAEAEDAGWDGVFTYDAIAIGADPMYDPWIVLAAMAMRTRRVRLGAIVFAPARRRPWKLAREAISLDVLSGGRLVLPVGLGTLDDAGFGNVGEPTPARERAERLDETLAILDGLESGEPFGFEGDHYRFAPDDLPPTPGPAAADPGLGRGRVAARAVDAPRRALGRDLRPGPGPGRQAGERARGAAADRGLAAAGAAARGLRDRPVRHRRRRRDAGRRPGARRGDRRRPRGGGRDVVDRVRLVRDDRRRAPRTDRGRPAARPDDAQRRDAARPLPPPQRPRDAEPGHDGQPVRRAPDAHGVDHEQLQEQEVALEDHADQRQAVDRVEQPRVGGPDPCQRQRQGDEREHHAVDRDRDPGDPRVLALGDRVAAVERAAVGHAAAELDRREVAGDREAQQVENDEGPAGMDAAEPGDGRHRIGPEHRPRDPMAPDARPAVSPG